MLNILTLLRIVTRWPVLQKVHGRTYKVLPLLVNIGFHILFHSPPGVLFTFPSRYYALSVAVVYLALEGGPPCFRQDSSCPVVLKLVIHAVLFISCTGLSPFIAALPSSIPL